MSSNNQIVLSDQINLQFSLDCALYCAKKHFNITLYSSILIMDNMLNQRPRSLNSINRYVYMFRQVFYYILVPWFFYNVLENKSYFLQNLNNFPLTVEKSTLIGRTSDGFWCVDTGIHISYFIIISAMAEDLFK